jgi:hypothetical protein
MPRRGDSECNLNTLPCCEPINPVVIPYGNSGSVVMGEGCSLIYYEYLTTYLTIVNHILQ